MSLSSTSERRHARRYRVALPVELDGLGTGRTRDVSTTGVFFETDETLMPGAAIKYALVLDHSEPDAPLRVLCDGDVVRVERRDEYLGVAATITAFRLDPDTGPIA
jgi:PilZ domain